MVRRQARLSDEGKGHVRKDPSEAEMEVDAANAEAGGPTTESLNAGVPSGKRNGRGGGEQDG